MRQHAGDTFSYRYSIFSRPIKWRVQWSLKILVLAGLLFPVLSCATDTDIYSDSLILQDPITKKILYSIDYVTNSRGTEGCKECVSPKCYIVQTSKNHWAYITWDTKENFRKFGDYEEASCFYGSLALVKKGGKYGYINWSGKYVVEPKFQYGYIFLRGFSIVKDIDGKWGVIQADGTFLIKPSFYAIMLTYKKPMFALVSLEPVKKMKSSTGERDEIKQGKWVVINSSGEIINDPKLDALMGGSYSSSPDESLPSFGALVPAHQMGGKWGYIDTTMKFIIKPQFDIAGTFDLNVKTLRLDPARIMIKGNWYFIDEKGKIIKEQEK